MYFSKLAILFLSTQLFFSCNSISNHSESKAISSQKTLKAFAFIGNQGMSEFTLVECVNHELLEEYQLLSETNSSLQPMRGKCDVLSRAFSTDVLWTSDSVAKLEGEISQIVANHGGNEEVLFEGELRLVTPEERGQIINELLSAELEPNTDGMTDSVLYGEIRSVLVNWLTWLSAKTQ